METTFDPKRTLFVHIHWMEYYDGRDGDEAFAGGQSRDGWMENYNFLDYEGNVFGGFWPGRRRKGDDHAKDVNVDRLGARGGVSAKGITVVYFAPHPEDGHLRLVGWHEDAVVRRRLLTHPDDGQEYNVTTEYAKAHLVPHRGRTKIFRFTRWWRQGAHRFGEAVPADAFEAVRLEMRRHKRR